MPKTAENFIFTSDDEVRFRKELAGKKDPDSQRLVRFLNMPDLSRAVSGPLAELVSRILAIDSLKDFDRVQAPDIVPASISFDLFNFPPDHPVRSSSDTYYVDDHNILRTHTTIMWYYYLTDERVREKIKRHEPLGVLCYGKVYRKDEIDRQHMNIFHQMDGLYLAPRRDRVILLDDLKKILGEIAKAIFGPTISYRFNPDQFPYTDPSIEMEIDKNGQWVEVLGAGIVRGSVLQNLGVNPAEYTGWAFGFGLERLAIISMELPDIRLLWSEDERVTKQLHLGKKYKEVSKYPSITRDFSFIVGKNFIPNDYFDLLRDIGGDKVEEVKLLDKYENAEKFGHGKSSYTYRVVFRDPNGTMRIEQVEPWEKKIYEETKRQFGAELR